MGNLFDFINVPMGYIIRFCYSLVPNYLLALLLLRLLSRCCFSRSALNSRKTWLNKPNSDQRKRQSASAMQAGPTGVTQQKMNEEVMKLYQAENYNPMGGCLPLLVQLPIIMSLLTVINNPLKYLCGLSGEVISAISQRVSSLYASSALTLTGVTKSVVDSLEKGRMLSQIDIVTLMHGTNFPLFADLLPSGFSESQLPNFTVFGGHLNLADVPKINPLTWLTLIPVLTFVFSFFSMKLTRKMTYTPNMDDPNTRASMQIMDFTMPLFSVWIAFTVPALIGVYWIYQNILSTLQQFILKKMYPLPVFTEEDYKIEKEMNSTLRREKKKVRSLHRIDEEDDEEEAEEEKKEEQPAGGSDRGTSKNSIAAQLIGHAELKDESDKNAGKEKGTDKIDKKKSPESKK